MQINIFNVVLELLIYGLWTFDGFFGGWVGIFVVLLFCFPVVLFFSYSLTFFVYEKKTINICFLKYSQTDEKFTL